VVIFLAISGYTVIVINNHGIGLLPVFFGDMAEMGWPGQFNLDFMCFLALSAFCFMGVMAPSVFCSWFATGRMRFFWWRVIPEYLSFYPELSC
jgi:hypothetical protein